MKKYIKKINTFFFSLFLLFFVITNASAALLQSGVDNELKEQTGEFALTSGGFESNMGIGDIIAAAVKAFLSLLGIIFIVLLVMAGYKYMTARGDEAKVEEALGSIRRAVIGLIIVAAAYSITYFVFSNLDGGSSGPTMMGS